MQDFSWFNKNSEILCLRDGFVLLNEIVKIFDTRIPFSLHKVVLGTESLRGRIRNVNTPLTWFYGSPNDRSRE